MILIGREMKKKFKKLNNDPIALKSKVLNIMSHKPSLKGPNKLPPLQFSKKKKNEKNHQKSLAAMKAPILNGQSISSEYTLMGGRGSQKNINNTNSAVDINDSHNYKNDYVQPSYNPRLLKDEK